MAALNRLIIEPGELTPPFPPPAKLRSYHVYLPADVQSVTIEAESDDEHCHVAIGDVVRDAKCAKGEVELSPGRNFLEIALTDDAGADLDRYRLTIIRGNPTPTWEKIVDAAPFPPRDSAGELVFQDAMWLFGGYLPKVTNDIWRSEDGSHWQEIGTLPTKAGINIPMRWVFQDQMWLTTADDQLLRSNDGHHWHAVNESGPWQGRRTAGSAVFKDRMWILGGLANRRKLRDVWSSTDGENWQLECEEAPWSPRQLHDNLVVFDDHLWVIGGGIQQYHPFRAYRDVWRSPNGRAWEKVSDEAPWPARYWTSCVAYHGHLWLLGGFRSEPAFENLGDVWYSVDGKDWRQLETPRDWSPRHEASPYIFKDRLWMVAGNAWPLMSDVWSLQLNGLCFLSQPPVEAFAGCAWHYRPSADFNKSKQPVRFRLIEHPDWLSWNAATDRVEGIAPSDGIGRVVLEAYDDAGESCRQTFDVVVLD